MSGWRCVGLIAYYVPLSAFAVLFAAGLRHGAILDLARSADLRGTRGMRPEAMWHAASGEIAATAERPASRGHAF
jgi:hypothetical protein